MTQRYIGAGPGEVPRASQQGAVGVIGNEGGSSSPSSWSPEAPGTSGSPGGAGGPAGAGGFGDPTLHALEALERALEEISRHQQTLERKLVELRRRRQSGMEWREILAGEESPGSMQVVSAMLASLAKASGTLRKELVDTLRREGASIPAIARLFGVTHQRVSNLLRRPSG